MSGQCGAWEVGGRAFEVEQKKRQDYKGIQHWGWSSHFNSSLGSAKGSSIDLPSDLPVFLSLKAPEQSVFMLALSGFHGSLAL